MLAARAGDAETVALLLENGADARARNPSGSTALDYLRNNRKDGDPETPKIKKWLQEAYESPTAGRQIKSKAGLALVAATEKAFKSRKTEIVAPAQARFTKKSRKP